MNISTKLLKGAAGSAGGAGLDVDEVFSTHVFDTTGAELSINNGIDLSTEGGLVWLKSRSNAVDHELFDTERGVNKILFSNASSAETSSSFSLTSFNTNGFTLNNNLNANVNNRESVAWTWRKAPRFFDCVTYTGNGVQGRTISHNLDHLVGMLIIKCTSHSSDWSVQHRMLNPNKYLAINENHSAQTDGLRFHSTAAGTSTFSVGSGNAVNGSGRTYVAYLFAHHNTGNPGEFGPNLDQDIIKCGSFTKSATSQTDINLGFEPQFIMVKSHSTNGAWFVVDTMRGLTDHGGGSDETQAQGLYWNTNGEENGMDILEPTSTGFRVRDTHQMLDGGEQFIYMAIRRGPLATPTDATKVFAMDLRDDTDAPMYKSGFVTDMSIYREVSATNDWYIQSRLTGVGHLHTHETASENTNFTSTKWDYMNGFYDAGSINSAYQAWMWKRAPSYFDVCAWTGNDTAGRSVAHNLGVVPEMIWVKNRSATVEWAVYHKDVSNGFLKLNTSDSKTSAYVFGADSSNDAQSATNIFLSSGNAVNELNKYYIGFLFATVAGVSKCGSYAGSNSDQTIDCGFTNGARFVLCKAIDDAQNWVVWDSTRGIVAGNEPYLVFDRSDAQITGQDRIDPHSSGFTLTGGFSGANQAGYNFIFYAIA
tara:strand:- start:147 stop:2093 length:1947 start_codon:yes stop_codon:yes gene_type:complete